MRSVGFEVVAKAQAVAPRPGEALHFKTGDVSTSVMSKEVGC